MNFRFGGIFQAVVAEMKKAIQAKKWTTKDLLKAVAASYLSFSEIIYCLEVYKASIHKLHWKLKFQKLVHQTIFNE